MMKIGLYDYNSNILKVGQKVDKFLLKNFKFMKEKNMIEKIKRNGQKYYDLNIEGIIFVTLGLDFKNFKEIREEKYMFIKEFIKNNS